MHVLSWANAVKRVCGLVAVQSSAPMRSCKRIMFGTALASASIASPAFADIQHFVAFKFKSGVTAAQKHEFQSRFLALQSIARRDGKPYIVSIKGGEAISREGFDQGFDAAFIVTFKDRSDRDYFVGRPYSSKMDPSHAALGATVLSMLNRIPTGRPVGIFVFDFDDSK